VLRGFHQWTAATFSLNCGFPEKVNLIKAFREIVPQSGHRGGSSDSWRGVALQRADYPFRRLRFAVFEADLRTGRLTKNGSRVRLQEQPFRLLAMLLEEPGHLVTRATLHARLWPRTTVEFDHGLNKAISKIRDALGDSAASPRFIETVARRGYRFLGDVSVVDYKQSEGLAVAPARSLEAAARAPPFRTFGRALGQVPMKPLASTPDRWNPAEAKIRSLAVLPLENLSGETSQDYFADGMTEELISRLGQISTLRVISRTSVMTYKNVHRLLPEIARELNVEAVVEGSVLRSGDQVRITVQLIQVHDDRHIWAESYTGDVRDTLALQSRVASAIAGQVRATLNGQEQATLATSKAVDPEAFEAYLKGRYFLNKRTGDGLRTAISYFHHAIETDQTYAEAWSGLADSYTLSGDWKYSVLSRDDAFPKARAAASKALALDDNLSEAHASLAFALDLYGWDWDAAEREYKRAIALNPGYATAHQWYAWHLIMTGQTSEAIVEIKKAESIDPLSLIISADVADALCVAHLYDEAIRQSQKTLEMDPNFAVGHYELGQALTQKHRHDEAIAAFQRAIQLSGHSAAFDSNLAYVHGISGRTADAMKIFEDLRTRLDRDPSIGADIALIHMGLGDHDAAMIWLNGAYEARFKASILRRPAFDPLRSDARFKDLMGRIGLSAES
jgi:TolB-like protein/DNA-binding winged helix-turn-helix (wHTH) protein/Flp pilus assembly protein TadD